MRCGLVSITKVILLCARQGIALRGKDDNLAYAFNSNDQNIRLGNFNAILKLKLESGDKDLEVRVYFKIKLK